MIVLGIILMIIGGVIFTAGEQQSSCLFLLIGAAINIVGIGILVSAF